MKRLILLCTVFLFSYGAFSQSISILKLSGVNKVVVQADSTNFYNSLRMTKFGIGDSVGEPGTPPGGQTYFYYRGTLGTFVKYSDGSRIRLDSVGAGGSGETNDGVNVGSTGYLPYKDKSGVNIRLRTLYETNANMSFSHGADSTLFDFSATPSFTDVTATNSIFVTDTTTTGKLDVTNVSRFRNAQYWNNSGSGAKTLRIDYTGNNLYFRDSANALNTLLTLNDSLNTIGIKGGADRRYAIRIVGDSLPNDPTETRVISATRTARGSDYTEETLIKGIGYLRNTNIASAMAAVGGFVIADTTGTGGLVSGIIVGDFHVIRDSAVVDSMSVAVAAAVHQGVDGSERSFGVQAYSSSFPYLTSTPARAYAAFHAGGSTGWRYFFEARDTDGSLQYNGTRLFSVDSVGNVYTSGRFGGGILAPAFKGHFLQTSGGTTQTVVAIGNASAINNTGARLGWNLSTTASSLTAYIDGVRSNTGGGGATYLAIGTNNGTTLAERIRISEGGKLGLNTTAPDSLLHVNGSAHIASNTRMDSAIVGATYLRIGSVAVPTNTTAGDITGTRLILGNGALSSTSTYSENAGTATGTSGNQIGINSALTVSPASNSSAGFNAIRAYTVSTDADTITGSIRGLLAFNDWNSTSAVTNMIGVYAAGNLATATNNWTTVTNAIGVTAYGIANGGTATGTYTNATVFQANANSKGAGTTLTNSRGFVGADQTAGTNNANLLLGTTTSPTGNYNIYASGTKANYFGGNISAVAAIASEGNFGVPLIVDTVMRSAQTADITTTNFTNAGVAGEYIVYAYLQVTTAGASGTISVTIGWTDDVGATTSNVINLASTTSTGRVTATPLYIRTASGNVTWATDITVVSGTPAYKINLVCQRVN